MTDDLVREMLREVADGVEPGDRLDAIREVTASGGRRTGRGWWTAGGVALVAASVVTALALTTGGTPRSEEPAPATSTGPSETATDPSSPEPPTELETSTVPVYYVGDTPDGQRLYRELRSVVATDPLDAAADALSMAPEDPDYTSLWPADAIQDVSLDGIGDTGLITVSVDRSYALRPPSMTATQAGLALEQVVRTVQAATRSTAAVRFYADGSPIHQVLGEPASEPLTTGSDLAVLAHVSLTAPAEGQEVDNDGGLIVDGLANSFEGNVVITVERLDDGEVLVEEPTIAGTYEDRLFPFTERLNVVDVPAGDYLVRARTDDPSGEGRFHTDSRRITVVD